MKLAVLALALTLSAHDIPRGCYRLSEDAISVVPHGFIVVGVNYFVRDLNVSRSGDDYFWVCTVGDKDYHLFVPPKLYEEIFR